MTIARTGASRKFEAVERKAQDLFAFGGKAAEGFELALAHIRIGIHPRDPFKARALYAAHPLHPLFHLGGALLPRVGSEVFVFDAVHLHLDVDAVEQRPASQRERYLWMAAGVQVHTLSALP